MTADNKDAMIDDGNATVDNGDDNVASLAPDATPICILASFPGSRSGNEANTYSSG